MNQSAWKVYQMPKDCIVVYTASRQDFTTPESYHGSSTFLLCVNACVVNLTISTMLHHTGYKVFKMKCVIVLPDPVAKVDPDQLFAR